MKPDTKAIRARAEAALSIALGFGCDAKHAAAWRDAMDVLEGK